MTIRDRYSSGYYPARFFAVNYWPQSRSVTPEASSPIRRGGFSESAFNPAQRNRQLRQIHSFIRTFLATQG